MGPFVFVEEIVFPSIFKLSTLKSVTTLLVPMVHASMLPPSISGVLISGDVRVLFVKVSVPVTVAIPASVKLTGPD